MRFRAMVFLSSILAAQPVFAQGANAALAESLFREGKKLLDAKNYRQACPKLAESFRLDPATGTLLALAMCHEGDGKTASAWAEYNDVAGRSLKDGRSDRDQAARARAAELEPKLSTLAISVPSEVRGARGLEVRRDGVAGGAAAWDVAVPTDPGEHVVEAIAQGKKAWKATVTVGAGGDKRNVVVSLGDDVPVEAHRETTVPRDSSGAPASLSGTQVGGLVAGGAGVVSLGVGGYFVLHAIQKNKDSKPGCDNQNLCDANSKQDRLDALSAGRLATVTLAAGGALVAVGASLYFLGANHGAPSTGYVRATPVVAGGNLGLVLAGGF